jgi:hypothetical protein
LPIGKEQGDDTGEECGDTDSNPHNVLNGLLYRFQHAGKWW